MSKKSDRRLIENEVIFRDVNKNIQEFVDGENNAPALLPFYCECSNPECIERIPMTTEQYSKLHKDDRHFITRIGHESPEVEEILNKESNYQVVEKHFTPPEPAAIDMALKAIKI
jgi:hypothetical protein